MASPLASSEFRNCSEIPRAICEPALADFPPCPRPVPRRPALPRHCCCGLLPYGHLDNGTAVRESVVGSGIIGENDERPIDMRGLDARPHKRIAENALCGRVFVRVEDH